MPTAEPIPSMPSEIFGELGDSWFVEQHTESMQLGLAILRIQTSGHQSDDSKRGTWHAALLVGKAEMASTQFPWCEPVIARAQALAWARDSLRGVAEASATADTVIEPEIVEHAALGAE